LFEQAEFGRREEPSTSMASSGSQTEQVKMILLQSAKY